MTSFESLTEQGVVANKKVEDFCGKFDQVVITKISTGFLALRLNNKRELESIYTFNNTGELVSYDEFGMGPEAEQKYELIIASPRANVYEKGKLVRVLDETQE